MKVWIPHEQGRELLGEVPDGVTLEVAPTPDKLPSDPADVEFWVPPFLAQADALKIVPRMTGLRVVQLLSAGAETWVGKVGPSATLHDARGVHDSSTAEWVMTAVLSSLRAFPGFARAQARREWSYDMYAPTDELSGKHVLIVGAGDIGRRIGRMMAGFDPEITYVARTARDDVRSTEELPRLLPDADLVVLIVPVTDETTGMVDADFLAAMKDGALLVNAARGTVVDTDALLAELTAGRLRAALDVTDPEPLPEGHPLWSAPGVLITPHVGGEVPQTPARATAAAVEQIARVLAGEPLANVVDRY